MSDIFLKISGFLFIIAGTLYFTYNSIRFGIIEYYSWVSREKINPSLTWRFWGRLFGISPRNWDEIRRAYNRGDYNTGKTSKDPRSFIKGIVCIIIGFIIQIYFIFD